MEKTREIMKTAVVILNWNGSGLLRRYLPSVLAGTDAADAAVIVVDNGSTDDSADVLHNDFPQVEVIRFSENLGFAEGYNRAIAMLADRFEYVVLLNSDVAVRPGWVKPLAAFLDANPGYAAVQPKLISDTRRSHFEYAGACGGFIDRNGYPYCRGRIFGVCEEDHGQYDSTADVMWASGAALAVRSRAYLDCGGLDKDFFAHMEEIDLCWRLRLAGWKLAAVPQSVVYHLGGGSLPAENPKKTYLNFRNNLLMLYKNLPDSSRSRTLLRRRLLDTIAWARYMASLDFRNAAAIWRAHRDFAAMRHNYDSMPRPSADLIKDRPDILTQFYIKGKKEYSRLHNSK